MNPESQDSWRTEELESELKATSAEVKRGKTPAEEVSINKAAQKYNTAKPTYNLRKADKGFTRWQKMYVLEKKKKKK